jgi:peptide/nickel transport system permease protein
VDPQQPAGAGPGTATVTAPPEIPARADEARQARREQFRLLWRSKTFIAGALILGFWVICAIFGEVIAPDDPFATDPSTILPPPPATTGSAPTASAVTCSRA